MRTCNVLGSSTRNAAIAGTRLLYRCRWWLLTRSGNVLEPRKFKLCMHLRCFPASVLQHVAAQHQDIRRWALHRDSALSPFSRLWALYAVLFILLHHRLSLGRFDTHNMVACQSAAALLWTRTVPSANAASLRCTICSSACYGVCASTGSRPLGLCVL